jgi:hypothetical protein
MGKKFGIWSIENSTLRKEKQAHNEYIKTGY